MQNRAETAALWKQKRDVVGEKFCISRTRKESNIDRTLTNIFSKRIQTIENVIAAKDSNIPAEVREKIQTNYIAKII